MTNREKYDNAFMETFEIKTEQLTEKLEYQSIAEWDSVGHMTLIANLEEEFEIDLEMDDVIEFGSYLTGLLTLEKYGIKF